jgi:hypothetical protein
VAEQVASGAMETVGDTGAHGLDAQIGPQHGTHPVHHGRPVSWVAVSIIVAGFIVGGVAMVLTGPAWWLFWTGAGIVVVGGIFALSTHILDDWY